MFVLFYLNVLKNNKAHNNFYFDYYKYSETKTNNNKLFQINSSLVQQVIVRIWLEGCDPYCVGDIAGKTFGLVLKFDSVDVTTAPIE